MTESFITAELKNIIQTQKKESEDLRLKLAALELKMSTTQPPQTSTPLQEEVPVHEPAQTTQSSMRGQLSKPLFLPPTFDGRTDFKEFKSLFEDAISVNGWMQEDTQAQWLRVSLRGSARSVINSNEDTYQTLMGRLEARYGDVVRRTAFEQQLPTRRRRSGEPLHQVADHIRLMCSVVYADLPPTTQERMAIKHFGMALNDGAAQYELSRERPETLEQAVEIVANRETYMQHATPTEVRATQNQSSSNDIEHMLKSILSKLDQSSSNLANTRGRQKPRGCPVCKKNHPIYMCVPCKFCKGPHYNNDCPSKPSLNEQASEASSSKTTGQATQ